MKEYIEGIATNFHNLCEQQLRALHAKFLAGNQITTVDFVMCSYAANVVNNPNGPFSAITKAVLPRTPMFEAYINNIM